MRPSVSRSTTASTVQSFASASPDLVSDSNVIEGRSSPPSCITHATAHPTPLSSTGSRNSHSHNVISRPVDKSRRFSSSGTAESPKSGKSFEALLASNETWVLRKRAQVAEGADAAADFTPPISSAQTGWSEQVSDTGTIRSIINRPAKYTVGDSEDLQSSADALYGGGLPVEVTAKMGQEAFEETQQLAFDSEAKGPDLRPRAITPSSYPDLPVYPGATITRISVNDRIKSNPTVTNAHRPDQGAVASMPFPRNVRATTPAQVVSSAATPMSSKEALSLSAIPFRDRNSQTTTTMNTLPSKSMGEESRVMNSVDSAQTSGTSFKDRFKKTSGLFRRFKASTSSQGAVGDDDNSAQRTLIYSKQQRSNAGASTPSLHKTLNLSSVRKGGSAHAGSLPSSPSHNSTQFVLDKPKSPSDVPDVPTIPARFAGSGPEAETPQQVTRSASTPFRSIQSSSRIGVVKSSSGGDTSAALGGPIDLRRASKDSKRRASPSSSSNAIRKGSLSKHQSPGSGAELLSKIKAWETEMDDALKESALDLERKTKLAPKQIWDSVPELPQLGLGIGLDHTALVGQESINGTRIPHQNRATLKVNENARLNRAVAGPSSAPSTPVTRASPSSIPSDRRAASALGGSTIPEADDGLCPSRPWERSHSSYLRDRSLPVGESESAPSNINLGSTRAQNVLPTGSPTNAPASLHAASVVSPDDSQARPSRAVVLDSFRCRSRESLKSPTRVSLGDNLQLHSEVRAGVAIGTLRRGHESTSAASVVSFETAAEGETVAAIRTPDPSDGDSSGQGERGALATFLKTSVRHDQEGLKEVDDENDVEYHPERSIRLVTTPATPATGPPCARAASSLTTIDETSNKFSASRLPIHVRTGGHPPVTPPRPGTASRQINARGSIREDSALPAWATIRSSHGLHSSDGEAVDYPDWNGLDNAAQAEAREGAEKCLNEDETWMKKEKMAEWLGGLGPLRRAARTHYFAHFDFKETRVDEALRRLCDKLFLRAETQQVDRILASFSKRFWECNPLPVYGSADNVHAVVFSLLLLNTDLHVADISERMTRTQFVRNTMSAIADNNRAERDAESLPTEHESVSITSGSQKGGSAGAFPLTGVDAAQVVSPRTSQRDSLGSVGKQSSMQWGPVSLGVGSLRGSFLPDRRQEAELDTLLKEMYASVKADRIRLPTSNSDVTAAVSSHSRRRAKPNMGPPSASSGSQHASKVSQFKRGSIRGIQGLLSANSTLRSDDTASFAGSHSSLGSRSLGESTTNPTSAAEPTLSRDRTPLVDPHTASGVSQPTSTNGALGFASMLTHTIIKESQEDDKAENSARPDDADEEIDDDELALIGAPWAKEGVLSRKHYWDGPQKRAKDKSWTETFVVVQKGTLSMFKFGESNGTGNAGKFAPEFNPLEGAGGFVVGGGNWLSRATKLGEVSLAHCLCNALPPPGYNRARPYVFALTLSSGAVYFFQAGTEDLVAEWVATCNYWAARQSKPPLAGGVSNMEYGWNKVLPTKFDEEEEDVEVRTSNREDEGADEVLNTDAGCRWSYTGERTAASNLQARGPGSTPPPTEASVEPQIVHADARSIKSGRSGRSYGSKVGVPGTPKWADAAQTLGSRYRNTAGSISSGYTGAGASHTLSTPLFRRQPASIKSFSFASGADDFPSSRNSSSSGPCNHNKRSVVGTGGSNERIYINEWKAPAAPTVPSALKEEEQMELCIGYIAQTEAELTEHNELRQPMLSLFSSRGSNYSKALSNWERKSNHLLAELVKWQSYVESLTNAAKLRNDLRDQRQMETALARADEEMAKVEGGEGLRRNS